MKKLTLSFIIANHFNLFAYIFEIRSALLSVETKQKNKRGGLAAPRFMKFVTGQSGWPCTTAAL